MPTQMPMVRNDDDGLYVGSHQSHSGDDRHRGAALPGAERRALQKRIHKGAGGGQGLATANYQAMPLRCTRARAMMAVLSLR